jgi:hypothetical protein
MRICLVMLVERDAEHPLTGVMLQEGPGTAPRSARDPVGG